MVRNIVGTLVDVGAGKTTVSRVAEILAACDRRAAGATAPGGGLTLVEIFFERIPDVQEVLEARHDQVRFRVGT